MVFGLSMVSTVSLTHQKIRTFEIWWPALAVKGISPAEIFIRSQRRNLLSTQDTAYKSIPMLTFPTIQPPALGEGGGQAETLCTLTTLCLSLTGPAPVFIDTSPGIRAPTDLRRGVSVTTGVLEM